MNSFLIGVREGGGLYDLGVVFIICGVLFLKIISMFVFFQMHQRKYQVIRDCD